MTEGLGEGARGQGPCRQKDRFLLDYFRARKYQLLLVPETGNGARR